MQAAIFTPSSPITQGNAMRAIEALARQAAPVSPALPERTEDSELDHIVELGYN